METTLERGQRPAKGICISCECSRSHRGRETQELISVLKGQLGCCVKKGCRAKCEAGTIKSMAAL